MANLLYNPYKESLLDGSGPDLTSVSVRAALIDTSVYTVSADHETLSDLSGILGTPVALASKTITNGVLDAADTTIAEVAQSNGDAVNAVVLYVHTGTAGTSILIAYIDESVNTTPNGEDIIIRWHANGIIAL